jgi:hypothetical protein
MIDLYLASNELSTKKHRTGRLFHKAWTLLKRF